MTNEFQFAHKVAHVLNRGNGELSPAVAARLHAGRTLALSHQRQPAAVFSLAGIGHWVSDYWRTGVSTSLLVLTLLVGVAGSLYWDEYLQTTENEEVDSTLLADELPFDAYLDDGFQLWVDRSSAPSSSF